LPYRYLESSSYILACFAAGARIHGCGEQKVFRKINEEAEENDMLW